MRAILSGFAATLAGGAAWLLIVRRRTRVLQGAGSSPERPKAETLPADLAATLSDWVLRLNERTPPEPETVSGALLFADDLAQRGYSQDATALRETASRLAQVPSAPAASEEEQAQAQAPEEEAEQETTPTALWVEHYVGGWNTLDDGPRGIVLSAFVHLGMQTDGYIHNQPSEVDALQAGERANELDGLGYSTLAAGLRELIADTEHLPEAE